MPRIILLLRWYRLFTTHRTWVLLQICTETSKAIFICTDTSFFKLYLTITALWIIESWVVNPFDRAKGTGPHCARWTMNRTWVLLRTAASLTVSRRTGKARTKSVTRPFGPLSWPIDLTQVRLHKDVSGTGGGKTLCYTPRAAQRTGYGAVDGMLRSWRKAAHRTESCAVD